MSNCKQLEEHYEAYALGALEGEDLTVLEEHLHRDCPNCTSGVQQARWVVSHLAYLAPEAKLPAALRKRVLKVTSGAQPRERAVAISAWAWIGVAALALISLYSGYQTRKLQGQLVEYERQLAKQSAERAQFQQERLQTARVLTILSAPGTRELDLKATEISLPIMRAYWNDRLGLVLSAQQIRSPAAQRDYQLWVVPKHGPPISAGIFRPDAKGQVLHLVVPEAKVADARVLAITDEPAGGSPGPTTTPIWVAAVSQ